MALSSWRLALGISFACGSTSLSHAVHLLSSSASVFPLACATSSHSLRPTWTIGLYAPSVASTAHGVSSTGRETVTAWAAASGTASAIQ